MSESDTNPQRLPGPDDGLQQPSSEVPAAADRGRPSGDQPGGERAVAQPGPGDGQPHGDESSAPAEAVAPAASGEPTQLIAAQPVEPTQAIAAQPSEATQPFSAQPQPVEATQPVPVRQPEQTGPIPPAFWQRPVSAPAAQTMAMPQPPQPGAAGPNAPQSGAAGPGAPEAGFQQPGFQAGNWYGPGGYPTSGEPPAGGPPSDGSSGQAGPRPSGGRFAKVVAGGLLALLLAGGGGVVGGLVVHATDNSTSSTQLKAAPSVDRSTLSGIVEDVKTSVVSIQTQDAEGSGVILSSDGYIVTNNHVVADAGSNTVQVTFSDSKTAKATIVGTDAKTDLAVVKAQGVSGLKAAKLGNSDAVLVGDTVLAIGSPLGLEGSVTAGIVSALHRTIEEEPEQQQQPSDPFGFGQQQQQQQQQQSTNIAGAIQTDAAINPGNSGGALVNTAGEVVGINTSILTSSGGDGNIGVGFAIPSNRVKEVSTALMKGQKVSHPYIGVNVGTADGNTGASVTGVVSGSPAEKAGLKEGDVIIKAGATDIHSSDDLLDVVQSSKVGDTLQLTVSRNGATQTVAVTVGESS